MTDGRIRDRVVKDWFRLALEGYWIGVGLALDWQSCGWIGVFAVWYNCQCGVMRERAV